MPDNNENKRNLNQNRNGNERINEQEKQWLGVEDLSLFAAFTFAYENLCDNGEISEEQRDKVLLLMENYKKYSVDEFERRLKEIFK